MGKKKKKKNKRERKKYNKQQFVGIICAQCAICALDEPTYCYNVAYLEDHKMFMSDVYPRLLKFAARIDKEGYPKGFINIMRFREVFCYSGICGKGYKSTCEDALRCFNAFRDQVDGIGIPDGKKKKKKKKQKREPVVFEPYPTFFISDNEEFKKEVEEILSDGNRNNEQNSD